MATQTIEFVGPSGRVLTAKLYLKGSDTEVDSQTATEATNRKSIYTASFTDVVAGVYTLIAYEGSVPRAIWEVTLTLTTDTFYAIDSGTNSLDTSLSESELHDALDSYTNKDDWKSAACGNGSVTVSGEVRDKFNVLVTDCKVTFYTEEETINDVAYAYTNDLGVYTVYLDPGTYWVVRDKAGYDFSEVNPEEMTVV